MHRHNKKKNVTKQKYGIDDLVYAAVVIGPLLTLPQLYSIWLDGQNIMTTPLLIVEVIWAALGTVVIYWLDEIDNSILIKIVNITSNIKTYAL